MTMKNTNIVRLTPLNPNVSLGKVDYLQRPMFPSDDKLKNIVTSDEFRRLLLTDASTDDGQDFLATYYEINDWAQVKKKLIDKEVNIARRYTALLLMVKPRSKLDNVWFSFYEGLHRHASLLITLLSAIFDPTTNVLKFRTLSVDYFKQHQLLNFKSVDETPHERLNKIFERQISSPMLTEPFPIKCIIPNKIEGVPLQGSVDEFTRRLCKYSELISDIKKTSASNSTFSLLSKALKNELSLCNREDRDKEIRLIVGHRYTPQAQYKPKMHEANMREHGNNDKAAYGWCDLLDKEEWHEFIRDPLNDTKRAHFLDRMTYRLGKDDLSDEDKTPESESGGVNSYPPYAISYRSMTIDVGKVEKSRRRVDPRHYNAFDLLPRIITILHAKEANELISKTAEKDINTTMINFVCRYAYATREYNQNTIHSAAMKYLPDIYSNENSYLNSCKGIYQVMPVAVFLMTCYNACFMFQENKTDNLMIETLERLDLMPNLNNSSLLQTFSK